MTKTLLTWVKANKASSLVAVAIVALAALHFLDRPSPNSASPNSAPTMDTSTAPAPGQRRFAMRAAKLALDCGGSASTISGDDGSGSIVVGADAAVHGDVGVCVVTFVSPEAPRCIISIGRYTVTPSAGRIEIVGPLKGDKLEYKCTR